MTGFPDWCPLAVFVAGLLNGLAGAGCSPVSNYVERTLERELHEVVGPADSYEVAIFGLRARAGEAERVEVVGLRVRPEGAPTLDRLEMELRGVRYDRSGRKLERIDEANALARLTRTDLAAYLESHRNLRDVSVTLEAPGRATIRARPEIGGLQLPRNVVVEVGGRIGVEEGTAVFQVTELHAAGVNLGATASRRLSDAINPLLDLGELPADLHVSSVGVQDTILVIQAVGTFVRE